MNKEDEITRDVMTEAVKHSIDKGGGKVLNTIGDIANGFLVSIFGEQIKYGIVTQNEIDSFRVETKDKINSIPEDKKVEPKSEIVGPALENSKYLIGQKDLRNMFSNLIASSVNSDLEPYVHGSFSEIIKQMSPLDAQILSSFKDSNSNQVRNKPICNYRAERNDSSEGADVFTNVFLHLGDEDFIPSRATSLENLKRLGLISIDYTSAFSKDIHYTSLESTRALVRLERDVSIGRYKDFDKATVKRGIASPTPLGKDFIKTCL